MKLPIDSVHSEHFKSVARLVNPPIEDWSKTVFLPAYSHFEIFSGSTVDISYFYQPPSKTPWQTPRAVFDRHLKTEEMWIVVEGDLLVPLAVAKTDDDPNELPSLEDMRCYEIHEGEAFVLRPNVWHAGPWAKRSGQAVRFFMLLSGHRRIDSQATLDHIVKELEIGVSPDWN
jgi:mannose-6-phosphate isomerase-like protein (cupin superfamily)